MLVRLTKASKVWSENKALIYTKDLTDFSSVATPAWAYSAQCIKFDSVWVNKSAES